MEAAILFAFLIFWCCFECVVVAGGLWMRAFEGVEFRATTNKESDATTSSPTVVDERIVASGRVPGRFLFDPASMPLTADQRQRKSVPMFPPISIEHSL